jgi:hypothetical protein
MFVRIIPDDSQRVRDRNHFGGEVGRVLERSGNQFGAAGSVYVEFSNGERFWFRNHEVEDVAVQDRWTAYIRKLEEKVRS